MKGKLLAILLFVFYSAYSENISQEVIVKNFSDDWLVYDKYYQAYVPYVYKTYEAVSSVSKRIRLDSYKGYILRFEAESGLCLFIDNRLQYKNILTHKETVNIPINTIKKSYSDDEEILTFYHPEGLLPLDKTAIIKYGVSVNKEISEAATIFPRIDLQTSSGHYIVLFLSMVALFTLYKRVFTKEYDYFMSFDLGNSSSEETRLPRPLGLPMVYVLILGAMALSLIVMIFNIHLNHLYNPSNSFLSNYFIVVFFILILLVIRFLYLYLLGSLFNFSKFIVLQYAETIKFFVKSTLIMATISVLVTFSGYYSLHISIEQFYYFIILMLVGMSIKVIFLFFRLINFRNLYLFSYICAAEVLPVVIVVKILLF